MLNLSGFYLLLIFSKEVDYMSNSKPIKIPNYIKNRIVQQNHYIDKAQAIATEIENWAASIGCNTCDTQFYSNTRL